MTTDPFAAGTQRNSTEEIIVINTITILMSVKASLYTAAWPCTNKLNLRSHLLCAEILIWTNRVCSKNWNKQRVLNSVKGDVKEWAGDPDAVSTWALLTMFQAQCLESVCTGQKDNESQGAASPHTK